MFVKNLTIPRALLQAEAIERRILKTHQKMPEVIRKIKVLKSGYNGEKTINYYLSLIPQHKYQIFHDLRLPIGDSFFQIDALLLSPKNILMLDGKNHSGSLLIEKNQMIQEVNDTKEIYENPIAQANRHKILLRYIFDKHQIPPIPFESFVVICKPSTYVKITPGYTEAIEKVCRAYDLLKRIEEIERNNPRSSFNQIQWKKYPNY